MVPLPGRESTWCCSRAVPRGCQIAAPCRRFCFFGHIKAHAIVSTGSGSAIRRCGSVVWQTVWLLECLRRCLPAPHHTKDPSQFVAELLFHAVAQQAATHDAALSTLSHSFEGGNQGQMCLPCPCSGCATRGALPVHGLVEQAGNFLFVVLRFPVGGLFYRWASWTAV